jgi:transketolase
VLYEGKDPQVAIIGAGPILSEALGAARDLSDLGIETVVLNMHTVKPIDALSLSHFSRLTGAIVTVEEHQIMGGLGSAIAEVVAQTYPVPIEFVGVRDSFGESSKAPDELWQKFGLKKKNIIEAVKKIIFRKNS